ncbi:MAG: hypothetical protein AAGD38_17320 [Acidobacteriota bacterium]
MRERAWQGLAATTLGVACLVPLIYLFVLSLAERWTVPDVLPPSLSGDRWLNLLGGRGELVDSLVLSLAISLSVAVFATAGGYLTSRAIAYSQHRDRLLLLAYVPFAFSPVVLGTCLLFLFIRLGLVGTVVGVVLAQSLFAYGFAIVFFMGWWTPRTKAY